MVNVMDSVGFDRCSTYATYNGQKEMNRYEQDAVN